MEKLRYLLFLILILTLTAGCALEQKSTPVKLNTSDEFHVKYQYSSEMKNDIIEITGSKLYFTYVDVSKLEDGPMVMEQRPYWTSEDLISIEKDLSNKEIDKLKNLIRDSDFFKLNEIEGVTEEGQRYYPYFLKVNLDSKSKEVEYRSSPEAEPMPESFGAIIDELYFLAGGGQ